VTDAEASPPASPTGSPAAWAPPSAPPFAPAGASVRAGGYAPAQGHATPAGYVAGAGYAPPAGYAPAPQGFDVAPRPPVESRSGTAGAVAFVLSLVAAVIAPIVGSVAGFQVGLGALSDLSFDGATFDWSLLTPVRDSVLLAEIAFWIGTVCGLWALVQGIFATVTRRGRGLGIAAIVLAALGAVIFFTALQISFGVGAATGFAS
jgi:hypothetical protein